MAQHNQLGIEGEKKAVAFLKKKGYNILRTNFRYLKHEVDIIAEYKDLLIVVEVKTRTTRDFGDPQDFLKPSQIKSIVITTDFFMQANNIELEVRFDVIAAIYQNGKFEIEHIEDAFLSF